MTVILHSFTVAFLVALLISTDQVNGLKREEQSCKSSEADPAKNDAHLEQEAAVPSQPEWDCKLLDACTDKAGFEAILALHQRLDDDANGNVDIAESDDFLRDELNYENAYERQKSFHRNDKQITADELWLAWKSSEVHNWTVEETIQWLTVSVELPQYAKNFEEHGIDGTALPRMAVNSMHFLSNLGIKDPIHKQKISLKAMDVVLFGPSRNHSYMKDALLALSLLIATGGVWFAYIQHKKAQSHLRKTMKDMESLQHAEESLMALQKELDKAKQEQEIVATEKKNLERRLQDEITTVKHQDSSGSADERSRIQQLEEELSHVLESLHTAERALQEKSWVPAPALQHWLQMTYELELRHYNAKKVAAEQQLAAAKEGCEKLRKKRSSFLGTFRVAHGNSIDDVDNRILQAKAALSEVTKDLQERLHRWKQIEILCGFSIVHNPGLRHLESLLGTGLNAPVRMPRTNSESTLAEEEASSFPAGVSAIQHLVHNSATLFLAPPLLPSSTVSQFISHPLQNFPSCSSPCTESNYASPQYSSYPSCYTVAGSETQSINGSYISIPYACSQRSGMPSVSASEHFVRRVPSPDLKSCASSSAILQRADALCYEHSDSYSTDGVDCDSFDERSSGTHSFQETSKPVFYVGESGKEAVLKSPLSSRVNRRVQVYAKGNKHSEQASSIDKISESSECLAGSNESLNSQAKTSSFRPSAVSGVDQTSCDTKGKADVSTSVLQKAKTA